MQFCKQSNTTSVWYKRIILSVLMLLWILLMLGILSIIFFGSSFGGHGLEYAASNHNLLDRFDSYITNITSTALEGIIQVDKVYLLSDSNQIAPEPNRESFGVTEDPDSLQWLINKVHGRLNGEGLLFTTQTPIMEGSQIHYYLDDTICTVTWKQVLSGAVYTFSEVKIQHPSQFRRFLADGKYGSDKQYLTSQMASSVNAVVASAGDFYKHRPIGLVVYNSEVERHNGAYLDNCFIDDQGDLLFTRAGELASKEELQEYVLDNNIRFSLSFGPVLIEYGKSCVPWSYPIGEISGNYSRAALCQLGQLHYVIVTVNSEGKYVNYPTLYSFADTLVEIGIEKAYTLDGGQTATIVMNDKVINQVNYGAERYISDIIYFATAMPESE